MVVSGWPLDIQVILGMKLPLVTSTVSGFICIHSGASTVTDVLIHPELAHLSHLHVDRKATYTEPAV